MPIDIRQYDSAVSQIKEDDSGFARLSGNLVSPDDRLRLKAYELWEDFYTELA